MRIGNRRIVWDYRKILRIALAITAVAAVVYFAYTVTRPTLLQFLVFDSTTGQILPDTVIEVQNDNGQEIVSLITDGQGWAGVKRLSPGTGYRAVVRHLDYVRAERRNIEVRLHRTTSIRLPLRGKPDGRLYVGTQGAYLSIIDTASFLSVGFKRAPDKLDSLPVSHLILHPTQPWLYVAAAQLAYRVDAISLEPQIEIPAGGNIRELKLSEDGKRLLAFVVADGTRVMSFDAETGEMQSSVQTPDISAAVQSVFFLPGDEAYVVDGGNAFAGILNTATGEMLHRLTLPFRPGWSAVSADGRWLYAGSSRSDQLIKLDLRGQGLVQRAEIGRGLTAIAVNPAASQLYLMNASLGLLLVVDAETLETVATLPVGRQPVTALVDPAGERVYVANAESRNISVFDVRTRQIIETVGLDLPPLQLTMR